MYKFFENKLLLSRKTAKKVIVSSIYYFLIQLFTMSILGLYFFALREFIKPLSGESIVLNTLYMILGLGAGYILFLSLLNYLHYGIYNFVYGESAKIRLDIAERFRKLPMSYFNKKNIADMTTLVLKDCTDLEIGISHIYTQMVGTIMSTLLIVVFLFVYEWRVALAIFWVIPIVFILNIIFSKIHMKGFNEINSSNVNISNNFQEYLDTIQEIKTYSLESCFSNKMNTMVSKHEKLMISKEFMGALILNSLTILLNLGVITSMLTTTILYLNNEIDILKYIMLIIVSFHIFMPYESLLEMGTILVFLKSKINRVKAMNDEKTQEGNESPKLKNYDLEFKNVKFGYKNNLQVINNVTFTAKQGEVTALIGPSGGGKSTLAKLATRFWDVNEGVITLGGEDISKIIPESLLQYYSMVFQDVLLFDMTVFENIKMGNVSASDEQVYLAGKLAHCDEIVKNLKNGYQTRIGENGCLLSGGEKQRISIARAILKNSPIIILDEATASLDVENETLIQDSLNQLLKDKTVLIIAHRMRTIMNANKIVVINNGIVEEIGKPNELIKNKNSYFSKMISHQQDILDWKIK